MGETLRILHLEDEPLNARALAGRMRVYEVQITLVDRVSAAIAGLEVAAQLEIPFHLLILDIHVSDTQSDRTHDQGRRDGYTVAEKALKLGYAPERIIFASTTPHPQREFPGIVRMEKQSAYSYAELAAAAFSLE